MCLDGGFCLIQGSHVGHRRPFVEQPSQAVQLFFSTDRVSLHGTVIFVANPPGKTDLPSTSLHEPAETDAVYTAMDEPAPGQGLWQTLHLRLEFSRQKNRRAGPGA